MKASELVRDLREVGKVPEELIDLALNVYDYLSDRGTYKGHCTRKAAYPWEIARAVRGLLSVVWDIPNGQKVETALFLLEGRALVERDTVDARYRTHLPLEDDLTVTAKAPDPTPSATSRATDRIPR